MLALAHFLGESLIAQLCLQLHIFSNRLTLYNTFVDLILALHILPPLICYHPARMTSRLPPWDEPGRMTSRFPPWDEPGRITSRFPPWGELGEGTSRLPS